MASLFRTCAKYKPSGFLAAGFFATVIAEIIAGAPLYVAISATTGTLRKYPNHQECLRAIEGAVRLAELGTATPEHLEELGSGWVAEEALAIALYCSLTADSFEGGVTLAVNHSGDSDSTGAMTGNILGTLFGKSAIPSKWLDRLELRDEIEAIADDLFRHFGREAADDNDNGDGEIDWAAGLAPQLGVGDAAVSPEADYARYPGW